MKKRTKQILLFLLVVGIIAYFVDKNRKKGTIAKTVDATNGLNIISPANVETKEPIVNEGYPKYINPTVVTNDAAEPDSVGGVSLVGGVQVQNTMTDYGTTSVVAQPYISSN